jgi:hypothetical protein
MAVKLLFPLAPASGRAEKEAAQAVFPVMEQKEQQAFFLYLLTFGEFEQDEKIIRPAGYRRSSTRKGSVT